MLACCNQLNVGILPSNYIQCQYFARRSLQIFYIHCIAEKLSALAQSTTKPSRTPSTEKRINQGHSAAGQYLQKKLQ